jgi:leucyl-tRNA synthetase
MQHTPLSIDRSHTLMSRDLSDRLSNIQEKKVRLSLLWSTEPQASVDGLDTGLRARNPLNDEVIPVYIANYVMTDYASGAVVGVPAHDIRDKAFASRWGLPIKVIFNEETQRKSLS